MKNTFKSLNIDGKKVILIKKVWVSHQGKG